MKNKLQKLCCLPILFALTVILACKNDTIKNEDWNNPFPKFPNQISLVKNGQKIFSLDSITSLKYGIIQFDETSNSIIGFNTYDKTFVFFDFATGLTSKKISIKDSGEHKVGVINPFAYSFRYLNNDSIFLYRQSHSELFHIGANGYVIKKYSLLPQGEYYTAPNVNPGEPFTVVDSKIFISAFPGKDIYTSGYILTDNLVINYNLKNDQKDLKVKFPDLYNEAVWGEYMHRFFTAFNPLTNQWIYSFPIDHNIYVYDFAMSKRSKYYAGSIKTKNITPLSFSSSLEAKLQKNDEMNNFRTQNVYDKIIYDKYNNLYYRLVNNAIPKEDIKKVDSDEDYKLGNFSIVILDENFKKIGEQEFDANKYRTISMFISKEGLCIPKKDINLDEQIGFDVFKPIPLSRLTKSTVTP